MKSLQEIYAVGEDSDDEIQEYQERLKKMKSKAFKDKMGSDIEDSDDGKLTLSQISSS